MREGLACSRGLVGEGTFDYLGDEGRLRARSLYVVSRPASLRFDVLSPLGGVLSTLTSDARQFSFADLQQRVFIRGPADECHVERALRMPIPPAALGELLTGQAPILVHTSEGATISWDEGSYLISIESDNRAREQVRLVPRDEDWDRPWQEQRLRVIEVRVFQADLLLYEAGLGEHQPANTAGPRVDPDGLEPDVPPSGPLCNAELPRRLRFEVPGAGRDIVFVQSEVAHNPPITPGLFEQSAPAGLRSLRLDACDERSQ